MDYFTGPWPNDARGAFCLSFDCDVAYAYSGSPRTQGRPPTGPALLAKQPKSLASFSRGLYGLHVGLPRILEFLAREELCATFFVPTANLERYPDAFRQVRDAGQEIGAHGHQHENLADFRDDPETEAAVLQTSLEVFAQILELKPKGYRSPAWDMNLHSPKLLAEAGFAYDSSLFAGEAPYRMTVYDPDVALIEIPIDWSNDDAAYYLFFKPPITMAQFHDPDEVTRIWQRELDGVVDGGGVFTLTCHPSVIGRHHRMGILDQLVAHARKRGDVWLATLEQVAAHVEEHWR